MQVDVCVVGGGLAGLLVASELNRVGVDDIAVLEAGPAPGGVAQTVRRGGFELEVGAGSFQLPGSNLGRILDSVGVPTDAAINSGSRYVFDDDELILLRPGPELIRTPLLSLTSKLRVLLEPLVHGKAPGGDESLESFCVRHFGPVAGSKAAWLAASGVFAGDPDRLSVEAAYPRLVAMERAQGSLLMAAGKGRRSNSGPRPTTHVPADGMDRLSAGLAKALGERFIPDFRVDRFEAMSAGVRVVGPREVKARRLVLAVPPRSLASLVDEEAAMLVNSIEHGPVVVAGFGGPAAEFALPAGFGALPTRSSNMATRGVLFESSYAPSRAPEGQSLLKVIAGGATRPGLVEEDDEALAVLLVEEISRILGRPITPSYVELIRHVPGIPQLNRGHTTLIDALESKLTAMGPVSLTGWGYYGVGVAQLADDAARIRSEITGITAAA